MPNSAGLTALRNVGTVHGADYLRLPVVGGDEAALCKAADATAVVTKMAIRDLLGGEWPLDRS